LRHTHFEYLRGTAYTGNTKRRLTQLVTSQTVYDGDDALNSKVTYEYDLGGEYLVHQGPPIRHDTTNFGPTFVQGRGDLNVVRRWDVTDPNNVNKSVASTLGYNTSGSVIFSRDPLNHQASISYTDSFSDSVNRNTLAYPTTATDAENYPSTVQYNYDFGAVTRAQDPKGAAAVTIYDSIGRIERVTNQVNSAYTRYVYASNQLYVQSYATLNDLSSEFYQITVFDGHGRLRGVASDHPGSVGGYRAQNYEYDLMERLVRQTNPTEVNVNWEPTGDDAAGRVWRGQAYDWKGRPTVSYFQGYNPNLSDLQNEPYKDQEIIYGGCGCAGGETETMIDAGQVTDSGHQRRKQKVVRDALGRVKIEQLFEWESAVNPYSTKTYTYDAGDRVTNIEERAEASGVTQNTVTIYDGHGRLWKKRLPQFQDGAYQVYEYNDDDTLRRTTDARGAVGNFEYYARKQVRVADYDVPPGDTNMTDAPTVNFKYDATGNMTEMDDGPGKVKYVYDTLGRLTEERRFFDTLDNPDQSVPPDQEEGGRRPFILKYEYDLFGKLKKFTDPRNDFIEYSYDRAGLLTSVTGSNFAGVTNYVTGIQYRAWRSPKQATYGSGHMATSKYNARTQIQQYDLPGVMGATYAYNPDKQLKTMKAATDVNPTGYDRRMDRSFLYDHAGRTMRTRASEEAGLGGGPNFLFRQDYGYDAFGNMEVRSGAYWPGNNGDGNGYLNTTYTNNKVTAATGGETWAYDGMGYLKKVTRYNPNDPSKPVTLQDNVIDAVGRIVEPGTALDGAGQVVTQVGRYYLRSRVFGGQIATTLLGGEKSSTRVYVAGDYLAEQIMAQPYAPDKVRWHFREPLNTMSRDVDSDATSLNIQAIDPLGANVMTTDGVNLNQYYACLFNPSTCNGSPPPSFYMPPSAYGVSASGNYSVKVDGALTIYSVGEIAAQLQRQGIQASVFISPALIGTPLTQGLAGSFVRRTTAGFVEVPGFITSKGKYEKDYEEKVYDFYEFVPGGEPEPQGGGQQGGKQQSKLAGTTINIKKVERKPCSEGQPMLTINGNPITKTKGGGASIKLEKNAAGLLSAIMSDAAGRDVSLEADTTLTLNTTKDGGGQVNGFTVSSKPGISLSIPGPNISVNSVQFNAQGFVTKVDTDYALVLDPLADAAVKRQLKRALGAKFPTGLANVSVVRELINTLLNPTGNCYTANFEFIQNKK
jgi:YD repeat-containing protein